VSFTYEWPLVDEFLDRDSELERLNAWWESPERRPVALIGRRRVGKSWLFRRLAHGKRATLLVAEQLPPGTQLTRFAELLEPTLGVRPDLPDIAMLFRVIFRAARAEKLLVVIDEFPWLLGSTGPEAHRTLSTIQAVMEEERDQSRIKLILCGSHVSQMDALFSEQNPMHGRLVRTDVRPLSFSDATQFMTGLDGTASFERYAIAGGMPLYLAKLSHDSVRTVVCREILDRNGPLWNEGRSILEQELREPRVYFAILEQLAGGDKELNEIAQPLRMDGGTVAKYLNSLVELRLVGRHLPLGATASARGGHWRLEDPFLRFWFRFVFPYQSSLESGLRSTDLYDGEVAPALADHVAPVFEDWCRTWLRTNRGGLATQVGQWWGNATNELRRRKERSTEEIDAVGTMRNRVTLVAECKWTNRTLSPSIVDELDAYKIPALHEAGFRITAQPKLILFSKAGYSARLRDLASHDARIELIDVAAELEARANRE
jgi:AAA+ ATPase superfamily predicted ATPase